MFLSRIVIVHNELERTIGKHLWSHVLYRVSINYTSQQDFGTRKVYCVSNVTFHAESKYAIKSFPSPTVFVQWPFKLLIFLKFWYFHQ